MADRAAAPVVGKVLAIGIVLAYVSLVSAALYGGVVPESRTAAGAELADRALASAGGTVEAAVPRAGRNVSVTRALDVPRAVRGTAYTLRADGRRLVLAHPHPDVGGSYRLALPDRVATVRGAASSDDSPTVRVAAGPDGLVVEVLAG